MSKIKNSSDEIHNHLITEYNNSLMKMEMDLYSARQTRMLHKVQRYFNSTPLRNGFARWMAYAHYQNKPYTISQLVKEMHSNMFFNVTSKIVFSGFVFHINTW